MHTYALHKGLQPYIKFVTVCYIKVSWSLCFTERQAMKKQDGVAVKFL